MVFRPRYQQTWVLDDKYDYVVHCAHHPSYVGSILVNTFSFSLDITRTQSFSNNRFSDNTRGISLAYRVDWIDIDIALDRLFLVLSFIYAIDIGVRFVGLGWSSFRANGWNIFDVVVVTGSIATTIPIMAGSMGFAIQQLQKLFLVSIAFKLVQRNDSLNQLFKTSVYVH